MLKVLTQHLSLTLSACAEISTQWKSLAAHTTECSKKTRREIPRDRKVHSDHVVHVTSQVFTNEFWMLVLRWLPVNTLQNTVFDAIRVNDCARSLRSKLAKRIMGMLHPHIVHCLRSA